MRFRVPLKRFLATGCQNRALVFSLLHDFLQILSRPINKERVAIKNFIFKRANNKNIKILDFGCGEGICAKRMFNELPLEGYVGVDRSWSSLIFAKRCRRLSACLVGDEDVCFKNGVFDFIILSNVLHHIEKSAYNKLLWEMERVLANNGYLVIVELLSRDRQKGFFLRLVTFFEERIKKITYWKKDIFESLTRGVFKECYCEQMGDNFEMVAFHKINSFTTKIP